MTAYKRDYNHDYHNSHKEHQKGVEVDVSFPTLMGDHSLTYTAEMRDIEPTRKPDSQFEYKVCVWLDRSGYYR